MNPATAEWVSKAEGDFATAGREVRARKMPNYDAVCFHGQQCAEKYLKAILQENNIPIPKINFLLELLVMILKFDSSYEFLKADLEVLENYSVRYRSRYLFLPARSQKRIHGYQNRANLCQTEVGIAIILSIFVSFHDPTPAERSGLGSKQLSL